VPDEAGQDGDEGQRQERVGADGAPVQLGIAQAERFEGLELQRTDDLPIANDRLTALVALNDGCDCFASLLLGAGGSFAVQNEIRPNVALDELGHDLAIGFGEEGADS
jgi:hypothetical protein